MAEYKCPYSARELLPIEACAQVKSLFCETKDGVWTPQGFSIKRMDFDPSFRDKP